MLVQSCGHTIHNSLSHGIFGRTLSVQVNHRQCFSINIAVATDILYTIFPYLDAAEFLALTSCTVLEKILDYVYSPA